MIGPVNRRGAVVACAGSLAIAVPAHAQEGGGVAVDVKPGKGIVFEDEGRYRLRLGGRFQVLETLREDADELESETQLRRARLTLDGYVFSESIEYKFQLGFAGRDLDEDGSAVLDAYLDLTHLRDLGLRLGLQKVPFSRQRLVSSGSLQFVDRARANGDFELDRDVGLTLHSDDFLGLDGLLEYQLGIFSGEGRGRLAVPTGYLYVARVGFRPFGAFDDYVEGDLERSKRPRLAIGAAVAWNEDAQRTGSNNGDPIAEARGLGDFPGFDYLHLGADAIFKWNGLSILGQFLWRKAEDAVDAPLEEGGTVRIGPDDGYGWFVQAGQMIGPHWEIAARYGEERALDDADDSFRAALADAGRELGGGVNWYVHEHLLKLQADYFRSWGVDHGALETRSFADGANAVRVQLQASF